MSEVIRPGTRTEFDLARDGTWELIDTTPYLNNPGWTKIVKVNMATGFIGNTAVGVWDAAQTAGNGVFVLQQGFRTGTRWYPLNASNELRVFCADGVTLLNYSITEELGGDGVVAVDPVTIASTTTLNGFTTNTISGSDIEGGLINLTYRTNITYIAGNMGLRKKGNLQSNDVRTYKGSQAADQGNLGGSIARFCQVNGSGQFDVFNGLVTGNTHMFSPRSGLDLPGVEICGYIKKGYGVTALPPGENEITGLSDGSYNTADLTNFIGQRGTKALIQGHRGSTLTELRSMGWHDYGELHGSVFSQSNTGASWIVETDLTQECEYSRYDSTDKFYLDGYYRSPGGKPKQRDYKNFNQWRYT